MANLADLVLLRNDPAVAAEFLQAARNGDVDAQYGMGLIYAEGRGVEQDAPRAFYWLTRAIDRGDSDAALLRRTVAASMTPEQFAAAESLLQADAARPAVARRRSRPRRDNKHTRSMH